MNLTQAIHAAARGHVVVSNAGRTYSAADLAPITLLGPRAVAFRTGEMTEAERKGTWSVTY